jgi:hypothetical protein
MVMRLSGSLSAAAALLTGLMVVAQGPPRYWPYAYNPAAVAPPPAYYDPYTSGLGPCPQRYPGDPPCRDTILPSYGQPDYWVR